MATPFFADGFNHYDTDNILMMWDVAYGATIESTTPRRAGVSYLKFPFGSYYVLKNFSSRNTIAVGFGLYVTKLAQTYGFYLNNTDGEQIRIQTLVDGSIRIHRGSTVLGTSAAGLLRTYTWNWFEFEVVIDDAAGSFEIKLNGQSILTDSDIDTKNQSSAGCTQVQLYGIGSTSMYIADLYFADELLGDCRIDTILPDGAGNYAQFTPSAGANYECVDDDGVPDGDDTYVKSSTAAHKDTYTFGDISVTGGTIHAVFAVAAARKDDAETRTFRLMSRVNGSDYAGAITHYLSDNYKYYLESWAVDPDTSSAWIESGVNGAEFGYELLS